MSDKGCSEQIRFRISDGPELSKDKQYQALHEALMENREIEATMAGKLETALASPGRCFFTFALRRVFGFD
ncbi:MAG: hypothetical protein U0Q18_13805 [Bryobacteraceae bacterium]